MLTASRRVPLQERRGWLVAVALGVVALVYTWPLVDGTTPDSFVRADTLLRMAAVTAFALACLSAGSQFDGRERAAMLLAAGGAQAWALVQAAHLAADVLGRSPELNGLDVAGALALSGSAAAALWLLREPVDRRQAVRVGLEWALVVVSVFLLIRLGLPPFWSAGSHATDLLRAAGISLLAGASLLTLARPGSTRRPWLLLPAGLAVVAVGLVAASLPAHLPARLPGALLSGGLVLAALATWIGHASPEPAAPADERRAPAAVTAVLCLLPVSAVVAAGPGLVSDGPSEPLAVAAVLVLGLLAVAHGYLLGVEARAQARHLSETELLMRHRAFHDELTGLPNRALFLDRLAHALDLHRRHRLPVSVLYGDLDGFKQVNDEHGHAAGDALLVAVAARLQECLRPEDTLARLGGDEFVLLLEHGSSAEVVADRLRQVLLEPFVLADRRFQLRMSIGIARVGAESDTPSAPEVIARADADMYARKLADRNRVVRAPGPLPLPLPLPPPRSEPALAAALARALHSGEVHVVYQPLVDARTGTVHGVEALVRWAHGEHVLLPGSFVELADRFGLAGTLTDVVLEQSCAQLKAWSAAAGHDRLTVAVNVTPSQMSDPSLAGRIRGAVQRHGLGQEQVVVETSIAALSQAAQNGAAAVDRGMRLSVAGFTGDPEHFSLLSTLPVRSVKLPHGSTPGGGHSDGDRLLQVLVALGREIDVQVVVERVERPEQLAALRLLSGVLAQGNLLSRPAEAARLDEIVLRGCPLPV